MQAIIKDEDLPVIIEALLCRAQSTNKLAEECNEPDDSQMRNEYLIRARNFSRVADDLTSQFSKHHFE